MAKILEQQSRGRLKPTKISLLGCVFLICNVRFENLGYFRFCTATTKLATSFEQKTSSQLIFTSTSCWVDASQKQFSFSFKQPNPKIEFHRKGKMWIFKHGGTHAAVSCNFFHPMNYRWYVKSFRKKTLWRKGG